MHTVRAAALAGLLIAAAAAATACGAGRAATPAAPTTTGAPAPTAGAATTAPPTTDAGGPTSTVTVADGGPVGTAVAQGPPACATGALSADLSAPNGSAGHFGYLLGLVNHGATTCTVEGYPGVSYVAGASGTQVGLAATRTATTAPGVVTLAPGGQAQAVIEETDPGVYSPGMCHLVAVRGLRIYPPNQRAALFVPQPGHACSNPTLQQLTVGPVAPDGVPSD